MELKLFVCEHVPADQYYKSRFKDWDERNRSNVTCPFHDDVHPSLSIGLTGGAAKCWAASCSAGPWGNIVHFEAARTRRNETDTARALYSEFVRPIVPEAQLATLQNCLRDAPKYRGYLASDCGIGADSIRVFGLGLDRRAKRIAIPVFDRFGNCVNVRMYKLPRDRKPEDEKIKVLNYAKGYGRLDLFPWPQFLRYDIKKPLFVMASEKECMLAISHGLQAICGTCGEDAWDESWDDLLLGYDIGVVGQNDDGGKRAAEKKIATLQRVANFCTNIRVPSSQKDFADWVVREKGNGLSLLGQMRGAQQDHSPTTGNGTNPILRVPVASLTYPTLPAAHDGEIQDVASISTAVHLQNKVIKCHGIIAGKAGHTYTIPWKFSVKGKNSPARMFALSIGRELLSFIGDTDTGIEATIRAMVGDDKAIIAPLEFVTAIEVEAIPTATIERDVPYVVQRCFYIGKWIDTNVPYEFDIIPTTQVRTQRTVGIIVKAVPVSLSFESQTFTEEELATLQIFKPTEGQTVTEKLNEIAESCAKHYTQIYNRPDWHIVALLTWCCPLGWKFPNEKETQRGWLNTLALGDTETGKSKVTRAFQQLSRCGQIVNAENCTYVGLVGGAVKMGRDQLMLRWGRIPLCDKQLVVIEELSGLTVDQISHMSDVRSSGVARIDKGGLSAETNARTRLLVLSNVRNPNKTLASYPSGVRAVQELVGHGEDIARFDLIITLVDADVSVEIINTPVRQKRGDRDFEPADFQRLVQFIWTLKPEQIHFTTEAYLTCLELTKDLSVEYHPAVPLFKGGSGRYKIARIAAAIATLQFSWDIEQRKVIVNEEHIEAAVDLLRQIYNKAPLRYDEWSKQMFDRAEVKDEEEIIKKIELVLPNAKKRSKAIESLMHSGKFSRDELCAVASIPITPADDLIGVLLRNRVLGKGEANTWEITPAGKRWLERYV